MLCCIIFSFGCVCWKLRHIEQFLYAFQYHDWCLSNKLICIPGVLVFSIPMWFKWSCSNACFLNDSHITTCLSLSITHQSLPYHFKMSSMFTCLVVSDLCLLASLWWCNLLTVIGNCLVMLPVVTAVLSCSLGCLWLSVWDQYSIACQVFLDLCFPCGFAWRASLQWTDLVQVCIWFWLCIGVLWEISLYSLWQHCDTFL